MSLLSVVRGTAWYISSVSAICWTVASFSLIFAEISYLDDDDHVHELSARGMSKRQYIKEGLEARVGNTFAYVIVIGVLGGFLGLLLLGWLIWGFLAYRGFKRLKSLK